jgi:hypothetical protein
MTLTLKATPENTHLVNDLGTNHKASALFNCFAGQRFDFES